MANTPELYPIKWAVLGQPLIVVVAIGLARDLYMVRNGDKYLNKEMQWMHDTRSACVFDSLEAAAEAIGKIGEDK